MFEVYLGASVVSRIEKHFDEAARTGLEAMGLLLGVVRSFEGREYVVITGYVTAKNAATEVSVQFTREALAELAGQCRGKLVVGWCHSHPGYGCFLSGTDLETQRALFSEGFNVAMVVDPLRNEKRFFKLDGMSYREASFVVVRKRKCRTK